MADVDSLREMYWQHVIRPTTPISGVQVGALLSMIANLLGTPFVITQDVEGANIEALRKVAGLNVRTVEAVTKRLSESPVIDWADFFLLRTDLTPPGLSESGPYSPALRRVSGLMRVVDSSDFYIYYPVGLTDQILDLSQFGDVSSEVRNLFELEFPV